MILANFDLQVTLILPIKFLVNRPFCSVEADFQDGNCSGHLVFLIRMTSACFGSTGHPDVFYQVSINWPFGSGEEAQNTFPR